MAGPLTMFLPSAMSAQLRSWGTWSGDLERDGMQRLGMELWGQNPGSVDL